MGKSWRGGKQKKTFFLLFYCFFSLFSLLVLVCLCQLWDSVPRCSLCLPGTDWPHQKNDRAISERPSIHKICSRFNFSSFNSINFLPSNLLNLRYPWGSQVQEDCQPHWPWIWSRNQWPVGLVEDVLRTGSQIHDAHAHVWYTMVRQIFGTK